MKQPIPPFNPGTMIQVPPPGRGPRPSRLTHELTFLRRSLEVMANPPADPTLRDMVTMLTTVTDALRTLVTLVTTHEALLAAGEPLAQELAASLQGIAAEISRVRAG